jgi:hypothetical protein
MYVEMTTCLSTAAGPYHGGEVYDVPDTEGRSWIARGAARYSTTPPRHVREFFGRLDQGAGAPCLFLPHVGEFGHRIMTGIRLVHWHKASRKVVCCRPGEEVLYPSATEYVTDWKDPIEDAKRCGTGQPLDWPEIQARYPGHTCIDTGNLDRQQELLCIHPDQRIPFRPKRRRLAADACLGIRYRAFCREKNWPGWNVVADAISAAGFTFAVIGSRPTTLDLHGQLHHSGDHDTDAAVELLQNCRLYIGSDTGTSHLAATIGTPMLVFRQEWTRNRDLRHCMAQRNPGNVEAMPAGTWEQPEAVISRTLAILRGE